MHIELIDLLITTHKNIALLCYLLFYLSFQFVNLFLSFNLNKNNSYFEIQYRLGVKLDIDNK